MVLIYLEKCCNVLMTPVPDFSDIQFVFDEFAKNRKQQTAL